MAANPTVAMKKKHGPFFSPAMSFRRKSGHVNTKKVYRKIKVKFKHILISFLALVGLFYGIHKVYLLLISWNGLNITKVDIIAAKPSIKSDVEQLLKEKQLVKNLLLLDINHMQDLLTSHPWIREVRVRKFFPPSLQIEIEERSPVAVLKKSNLYLIDEEGKMLRQVSKNQNLNLPLLLDQNGFEKDYEDKINLAWDCLDDLPSTDVDNIEFLDLTQFGNVKVKLKNSDTWLIFGRDLFAEKMDAYHMYAQNLGRFGPLEYVDLRFADRFYIKPKR